MMKKRQRFSNAQERKKQLFEISLEMAIKHGYRNITRPMISEKAGCSLALISKYFCSMDKLRNAILTAAVRREITPIIAQGIINQENRIKKISPVLKQKALDYLKTF